MTHAWDEVVGYLRLVGGAEIEQATDRLDAAIDRDGIGAINDAFADACRALMDRIVFPAGTVDIHTVVDHIALRICDIARDNTATALDRQRSLLVFLGSEGLPCAARDDVAQWSSEDRLRAWISCTTRFTPMRKCELTAIAFVTLLAACSSSSASGRNATTKPAGNTVAVTTTTVGGTPQQLTFTGGINGTMTSAHKGPQTSDT